MKKPLFKVRQSVSVLTLGIILIVLGLLFPVLIVLTSEGDRDLWIFAGIVLVMLVIPGLYNVISYIKKGLKVYEDGTLEWVGSFGATKAFAYDKIAKISQTFANRVLTIRLKDTDGRVLAKLQSNWDKYDKFYQWLLEQKRLGLVAQDEGIGICHNITVEPVKVLGTGVVGRILYALLAVACLFCAAKSVASLATNGNDSSDSGSMEVWFDPTTDCEEEQFVGFYMISYPIASFELSDAQGIYFVFDDFMTPYLVCMDNRRLTDEFAEIYEYTFSESEDMPAMGVLEGYATLIPEDMREIAIEEFNLLFDDEILTEENFEEYLGSYYLDSTYVPEDGRTNAAGAIAVAILCLGVSVFLIYYIFGGYKKGAKKISDEYGMKLRVNRNYPSGVTSAFDAAAGEQMSNVSGMGVSETIPEASPVPVSGAGDLPVPRNIILSILATIVCALPGALLWILFYRLDRIVAIAGFMAVAGAMFGWATFGRRPLKGVANIWCMMVGVVTIFAAHYVSYAWEIADVLNESNPGRAEFGKVLMDLPRLMSQWELWGNFFGNLALGLIFAVVAGVASLFSRKKAK